MPTINDAMQATLLVPDNHLEPPAPKPKKALSPRLIDNGSTLIMPTMKEDEFPETQILNEREQTP